MTEGRYEDILLEMQTLSQKYALGKTPRRRFEKDLKDLQEKFSSEILNQRVLQEKRRAFNQGFLAAFGLAALLFVVYRIFRNLWPYWG